MAVPLVDAFAIPGECPGSGRLACGCRIIGLRAACLVQLNCAGSIDARLAQSCATLSAVPADHVLRAPIGLSTTAVDPCEWDAWPAAGLVV